MGETYWINKPDLASARTSLVALANARRALFDSECRIVYWRLSAANIKGDTDVKKATDPTTGSYGQGTPPVVDMMPPEVSLKVRMQYSDMFWAVRLLGFIPEECVTDGEFTPATGWNTAFTAYVNLLISDTVGVFKDIHTTPVPEDPVQKGLIEVIPLSITTRKRGRPFGLRRGRSVLR
jgi:hypothetical protein